MKRKITGILTIVSFCVLLFGCKFDGGNPISEQFTVTIENTGQVYPFIKSGAFTTPVGATDPAPILPGEAYEFEFTAPVGAYLSLATMFAQSNDWIYATDETGIALYNPDGSKVTGDVTSMVDLYDVGTEADQEPGTGSDQAPRQSGPDTGADDPDTNARTVEDPDLPANEEAIQVTISSTDTYGFKVRIENVSNNMTLQTSEGGKPVLLSPGVYAIHSADEMAVLFEEGSPDYEEGLEGIAEDGNPETLAESLAERTGVTPVFSPGTFAVYHGNNPIFKSGDPAMDNGLEGVAEDGNPALLSTALESENRVEMSGVFNTPEGVSEPAPIMPGQSYTFSFDASRGERLSFVTMYAQSNDYFYAPVEKGIDLYEGGGPNIGDVSDIIQLWDAGTEMNEEPGIGSNQAPRQPSADTGPADTDDTVRRVDSDDFPYPKDIKVTISLNGQ